MTYFLALQSTYHAIEYALYYERTVIECGSLSKIEASSMLVPALKKILARNSCSLNNLAFITANRGPAPFTSLRTLITTINGIRFAQHIPLIGIDGFQIWFSMLSETSHDTAIIMNAFNREVYVALRQAGSSTYRAWYGPIEKVAQQLQSSITTPVIVAAGNAIPLYRPMLEECMRDVVLFNEIDLTEHSLHYGALLGLQAWRAGQQSITPLTPLYLKAVAY